MMLTPLKAAVAHLDRVFGFEPKGSRFDSCQPHMRCVG
jgi:hypothetical protein